MPAKRYLVAGRYDAECDEFILSNVHTIATTEELLVNVQLPAAAVVICHVDTTTSSQKRTCQVRRWYRLALRQISRPCLNERLREIATFHKSYIRYLMTGFVCCVSKEQTD